MLDLKTKLKSQRKQHNLDLIKRMRNGEPLNAIDSKSSWYPPRPTIAKDPSEMARVYSQLNGSAVLVSPDRNDAESSGAKIILTRTRPFDEAG
ncbi:MAG: hypothetical protein NTY08_09770 [Proteobacteria bacterium]|nr:hypothetical protein [Pseudomonadota bacterium]